MAKNFGNPDPYELIHSETVAPVQSRLMAVQDNSATGFARQWAAALFWLGVVGLVPPFTPGGVIMMVVGAVFWSLCPVVQLNEDHLMAETRRTGNGCGWFLMTCAVILCVGVVALALGVGALDAMIQQGMVQP